jgi:hypothetical protein
MNQKSSLSRGGFLKRLAGLLIALGFVFTGRPPALYAEEGTCCNGDCDPWYNDCQSDYHDCCEEEPENCEGSCRDTRDQCLCDFYEQCCCELCGSCEFGGCV